MKTPSKSNYRSKKQGPKKIVHVKTTEQNAMKMLWRTGVATKRQLEEHFALKGQRLSNFEYSGFFKFNNDLVVLSDRGIRYCEENLQMKHRYYTAGTKYTHDIKQTEAYLRLPERIRETWKTEGELRSLAENSPIYDKFKDHIENTYGGRFKPTPDAAVYSERDGGYVAFECVTDNYTHKDVQMKHEFARTFLKGIYTY